MELAEDHSVQVKALKANPSVIPFQVLLDELDEWGECIRTLTQILEVWTQLSRHIKRFETIFR